MGWNHQLGRCLAVLPSSFTKNTLDESMKLIQRSLKLILILQEFHFPLELPNSNLEKNNLQRGGSFSHSFQLWLKVSLQKNQLKECKPCKMLFVPSFLFKLGSNLGKSKHIHTIWEERIEKKNNLWYWICVWDQGVFSKEWTRFLFKLCVFCSCCTWWKLHVAMWSGAPWNPHALCAGPKALHRNCCPCCTMLHRCEPHWVAPKKNVRLAAKCFQSNGKWFWKPAGKVQYISWWFTAPKLNKQIWACFLWWG